MAQPGLNTVNSVNIYLHCNFKIISGNFMNFYRYVRQDAENSNYFCHSCVLIILTNCTKQYSKRGETYVSCTEKKNKKTVVIASYIILTLTVLCANSADEKLMIFLLFFPESKIWYFIQIISVGDNLHVMSNPIFWEKLRKSIQNVICWNFYPAC